MSPGLLPYPDARQIDALRLTRLGLRDFRALIDVENARRILRRAHWTRNAISAAYRQQAGASNITFKNSGGSAALSFASVANFTTNGTGGRESVKADFQTLGSGSNTAAQIYEVRGTFKWLTTAPTDQATIEVYANPSGSATAGTDNLGGCAGVDQLYAGINTDIPTAIRQLVYCGSFVCSAKADTDQTGLVGYYQPTKRYASVVVWNKSGRLLHSTEGNQALTFSPIEPTSDAS